MSVIENFISKSNEAKNLSELFGHLSQALKNYGIEYACYCLLNDHPTMDLKKDWGVISSYPERWMQHFVEKNLVEVDPTLPFCFVSPAAFSWNEVFFESPYFKKRDIKYLLSEAKDFGLMDGIGVPIHGPSSEVACLGLASLSKIDAGPNLLSAVQALGFQFHTAYGRMAGTPFPNRYTELTIREREILMWSAEGKGVYAIGEILNISENTVKYHLKNIYKKFGVTDRLQAVLKALFLGLINPPNVRRIVSLPR